MPRAASYLAVQLLVPKNTISTVSGSFPSATEAHLAAPTNLDIFERLISGGSCSQLRNRCENTSDSAM